VDRALAKAPGDRHPSCAALVAAAEAAVAGAAPASRRRRRLVGRRVGRGRRRPWAAGLARRPVLLLAATVVVLVAVVVAAVLVARDGRAPAGPAAPTVVAAANQAVRIDSASYQMTAVAVGTDPVAVSGGEGLVWVASRGGAVTVVDPTTNQVQETLPASGSGPVRQAGPGLAFASGSLWVANTDQRQVTRAALDTDATAIAVDASPVALAASQDAVWVVGRAQGGGRMARIDPVTNQVGSTVRLPHPPTGLAVTRNGRTAWVATPDDRAIYRIDTRPGGVVERIGLPHPPDQAVFGADAVWVTSSEDDAVMRIDAASDAVQATIRVGNGPTGIAFGEDRVWVANSQDGTVSRIDPETHDVGTLHLGFRPAAVAVEHGAVWVALAA
jgi:YVTN family beta-propeller protein